MTDLFNTTIIINKHSVPYLVYFNNEEYHFHSAEEQLSKSFILKREHEEWRSSEDIDEELKNNAITTLEKYLLSQH